MTNTVVWIDVPVVNLDRAIGFYSALFGKAVEKQSVEGFDMGVLPHEEHAQAVFGCLCVCQDNQPSKTGPLVYLSAEGRLDAAVEAARKNGGEVLAEKHPIGPYGFRAVIVDSEGNRIALHSQTA